MMVEFDFSAVEIITAGATVWVMPTVVDALTRAGASNALKSKTAWVLSVLAAALVIVFETPTPDVITFDMLKGWTFDAVLASAAFRAGAEVAHGVTKNNPVRLWLADRIGGFIGRHIPQVGEIPDALTPTEQAIIERASVSDRLMEDLLDG